MNAREIRKARARLKLSRFDLAARLNVSESTVWRWERGKQKPTPHFRELLRRVLSEGAA